MDKSKKTLKKQYLESSSYGIPQDLKDRLTENVDTYIRESNVKNYNELSKKALSIIDNAKSEQELYTKLPELFPKNLQKNFASELQKDIQISQSASPERFSELKQKFGEIDKLNVDPEQKILLKKYERAKVNALPKLGEGGFNRVYDIGNEQVMKLPRPMLSGTKEDIIRKYVTPKKFKDTELIEKAQLGILPNEDVFLLDKKLTPIVQEKLAPKNNSMNAKTYNEYYPDYKKIEKQIEKKLERLDFNPFSSDIKPQNIGVDKLGNPKIIDTGNLSAYKDTAAKSIENAITKSSKKIEENIPQLSKNIKKTGKGLQLLKAIAPLSVLQQGVSAISDIKEGKPNTAAAKIVTGMAPPGAGELEEKLLEQAEMKDKYPYLSNPTYQQTLKNIGKRKIQEGKSPIVEGFHGEKVDTSATEGSMFENLIKKIQEKKRQG
jgi:hypothetical protein